MSELRWLWLNPFCHTHAFPDKKCRRCLKGWWVCTSHKIYYCSTCAAEHGPPPKIGGQ